MSIVSDKLSTWLARELNERAWSARELARRIKLSGTSVSRYLEGTRTPSPKTCQKIAAALGTADPQEVMRLAGHLPPLPPPVEGEEEAINILRNLPRQTRAIVMQILRGLNTHTPAHAIAESSPSYIAPTLDDEIANLIDQYPDLQPLFDEAKITLPEHAIKALIYNVQIWIRQRQDTDKITFLDFHRRLGDLLGK